MRYKILKVKEWLKYSKPDYEEFLTHLQLWEDEGKPYGLRDLLRLAESYKTPIPSRIDEHGILHFDITLPPKKKLQYVNLNINIMPSEKDKN